MLDLGWGPYQNDHEDANGQFEMNWGYDDALVTADRHAFFKFMLRRRDEEQREAAVAASPPPRAWSCCFYLRASPSLL